MKLLDKIKHFIKPLRKSESCIDISMYSNRFISDRLSQIYLSQNSNSLLCGSAFADIIYTKNKNMCILADQIKDCIERGNKVSINMFMNYKIYCQDKEDKNLLISIINNKYSSSITQNEINKVMTDF